MCNKYVRVLCEKSMNIINTTKIRKLSIKLENPQSCSNNFIKLLKNFPSMFPNIIQIKNISPIYYSCLCEDEEINIIIIITKN